MELTEIELLVAPQLVLRAEGQQAVHLSEPWPLQGRRPQLLGAHGLWLRLADGTTREITYSYAASHEQALSWLLHSAQRSAADVVEARYWTERELLRYADYQLRYGAKVAADCARLDVLLSADPA